jgi:hypothetical protein
MQRVILIISCFFLAIIPLSVSSQGCSDAGVCTIHSIKTNEPSDTLIHYKNTLNVGLTFGLSKHEIIVLTPYLEYTRDFGKKVSLTTRFTSAIRSGELATKFNPADITLSISYAFIKQMKFVGGFKIPLNNANLKNNGYSLPMEYQTSLGTLDLLLGLSYSVKRFSLTAAYQQPLIQNSNTFLTSDYNIDAPQQKYYSTNNYHRNADALLRISYIPVERKKLRLITSLLPIFHIQNDSYTDSAGNSIIINRSQGLTLNITAILQYKPTKNQVIEFTAGAPALSRKVRPDGLSKFGIGIEYKFLF